MVAVVRVQPIIATLGTYLAYQGITLEMLPMAGGQAPEWLVALANSRGGVPGALVLIVASGIAGSRSNGPRSDAICSQSAATRGQPMRRA